MCVVVDGQDAGGIRGMRNPRGGWPAHVAHQSMAGMTPALTCNVPSCFTPLQYVGASCGELMAWIVVANLIFEVCGGSRSIELRLLGRLGPCACRIVSLASWGGRVGEGRFVAVGLCRWWQTDL